MLDSKITFPRLKAFSNKQTVNTFKTISSSIKTTYEVPEQRGGIEEKASIKYQYISKSPHYFKIRNKSAEELPQQPNYQTIAEYVGQRSRIVDKELLLSAARDRLRKLRRQDFNKQKVLRQLGKTAVGKAMSEQMGESKYQNFRPLRVPIKESIKYLLVGKGRI